MPKFRNTRTGRVVHVPDQPQTRTDQPGREKQWARVIYRMDKSKRWERVPDDTPIGMPRSRPKHNKGKSEQGTGSDLSKLKKAELEAIADERGVDLGEAKTNAEMVAAIEEAGAVKAGADEE